MEILKSDGPALVPNKSRVLIPGADFQRLNFQS